VTQYLIDGFARRLSGVIDPQADSPQFRPYKILQMCPVLSNGFLRSTAITRKRGLDPSIFSRLQKECTPNEYNKNTMSFLRIPFFDVIADAQTVLIAGAGGGYDIFSGLPLYFGLRSMGKTVHLANLSFSHLYGSTGTRHGEALVEVTYKTEGSLRYFPELHLANWFHQERGEDVSIFGIDRVGARPVAAAYKNLVAHLGGVDAIILIDGGTDSLMRGDEVGLGTPEEDIASINAVDQLEGIATKLLVCLGFGVDTFHGVCHSQFLEAVADITRVGGYLGAWSLTREMPEVMAYESAAEWTHRAMFNNPSIVTTSIVSAIEGHFGNYHANYRTQGSELFINPLMSFYWSFRLDAVARRCLYLDMIQETETWQDMAFTIDAFRRKLGEHKEWQHLPM
jgi:hypothetical protein